MRPTSPRALVPALVLLVAISAPAGALAQAGGRGLPTPPEAATSLEQASRAFATALAAASADRMSDLLAADGIRLQLEGPGYSGLSSRQALATLRDFLRNYEAGQAVVLKFAPIQGTPTLGFAEVLWTARVAGTAQELRQNLFVGLASESGAWLVDEVRILP